MHEHDEDDPDDPGHSDLNMQNEDDEGRELVDNNGGEDDDDDDADDHDDDEEVTQPCPQPRAHRPRRQHWPSAQAQNLSQIPP